MSGAAWWVVLAAAAIGAAAGITGTMWASRVARRANDRAEWFRRLQWAWQLTWADDRRSIAAGMAMMDYLLAAADRRDGEIIVRIAPIAREVGSMTTKYAQRRADVDIAWSGSNTGTDRIGEEDDSRGQDQNDG